MTLVLPSYIPVSEIETDPITYEWSDKNPYRILGDIDPFTERNLAQLSDRAVLAYSIGCAEWVVYRLHKFCDDNVPMQFIESCWACEMSRNYAPPSESDESEWKGRILGPIDLALMTILNTILGIEDGSAESDAAFAELIPLHVLPKNTLFNEWRGKVLHRLVELYPRDERDPFGRPVPREALDPAFELTPEKEDNYVKIFLSAIKVEANPFLESPIGDP